MVGAQGPPNFLSDFSWASAGEPPQRPSEDLTGVLPVPPRSQGPRPSHLPLPSFQDAVTRGAMTQQPLKPTGPVSHPLRRGGSWPTTATRGVSGAVAGAPNPLSYSSSSSSSPNPYLLAPCVSGSALFLVPRSGHLQLPLPPWDRPAPPSRPLHPPQHPPWPAAIRPCSPQLAPSWSPAGPLTPGPCLPQQPAAPSPPTAPVLTQPSWALCPCCLASCLCLGPALIPHSGLYLGVRWSLTLGLGATTSASSFGVQGCQASPVPGASIRDWPGAWAAALSLCQHPRSAFFLTGPPSPVPAGHGGHGAGVTEPAPACWPALVWGKWSSSYSQR